jgi:cysteine desulfurase/selenocysteine lyase
MDVRAIREDFPLVEDVVYLDSASTSLTPEPVLESIMEYYRRYNANVGRGVHRLSQMADQRYKNAHRKVAAFIGAAQGTVVFTKNATEAINMVASGLEWRRGEKVVTTLAEHHSNLLPWMRLRRRGVGLDIVELDGEGLLDLGKLEEAVDDHTRLVAMTQLSNALGAIYPVKEIAGICQERGAMLLVDGAQSVPHLPVEVNDMGCDFLCFSGHKMLGPKGTGVLWTRKDLEPLQLGGGMVEDASSEGYELKGGYEGFEAGTPNVPGGIGLGEAVGYLDRVGMEEIRAHERGLVRRLLDGLEEMEGVEVYGPGDPKLRGGVVSFNVKGLSPHEAALMLDERDIMVRSGHHCCIPLMKHLGLREGTVRASLYLYNTGDEVERLLASVEEMARVV